MNLNRLLLAFSMILMVSAVGCSESGPELVPTSGIVKIDGVPAQGIMVRFMPDVIDDSIKLPSSQGLTNAEGKFELRTTDNKVGAAEGPHRVSLFDTLEERVPQGQTAKPARLDSKFSSGAIEITVGDGEEIVIEATGS
ncbi:hypothetical protein [Mariniblastus fucicola]|nr:hypothetical protein [Mariniblastus fucicola]